MLLNDTRPITMLNVIQEDDEMNLSEFKSSKHRDRSHTYSGQDSNNPRTSRSGSLSSEIID